MISSRAIIYPKVKLGKNCVVEDYAIIGVPPDGKEELETVIGDNAVIRSHTVIYHGNIIGSGFHTGNKANIREENRIGDNVSVGTLSVVEHHVTIGSGVRIHTQAFVPEFTILEDDSWVGPQVVMTNVKYPLSPKAKETLSGVFVGKGAILGANSTILPGIKIGAGAVVGAGSVVVKDVPPLAVVVGNPARIINSKDKLPYGGK
jgi:acetyltransferase-like isoleucine patch superfamily enzyme